MAKEPEFDVDAMVKQAKAKPAKALDPDLYDDPAARMAKAPPQLSAKSKATATASSGKKHSGLRWFASAMIWGGVLDLFICGLLAVFLASDGKLMTGFAFILGGIGAAFSAFLSAGLILVLVDIEENTRATRMLLEKLRK